MPPILRVFAGPNGSGKSTIKKKFDPNSLGIYLNTDELKIELENKRVLSLESYRIPEDEVAMKAFINDHALAKQTEDERRKLTDSISIKHSHIVLNAKHSDDRLVLILADYIRECLIVQEVTFSFETVMSHPSKIEVLKRAKQYGFLIFLYFIATDDPALNVERVNRRARVFKGHFVTKEKVVSRYFRSLELLYPAIKLADITELYDNSSDAGEILIARINDGKQVSIHWPQDSPRPNWFVKYVESHAKK